MKSHSAPCSTRLTVLIQAIAGLALDSTLQAQPQKYLMLDTRVIERVENAKLVLGSPVKHEGNPVIQADKPWENSMNNLYPNVIWDEQEKIFKLWYKCVLADKEVIAQMDRPSTVHDVGWYLLYATSKDGIRWGKPELGLHKFAGSAANNIVARDCPNVGVFKDLHDADASRRYKMVSDVGLGKPQVRFSADGIHWGDAMDVKGFSAQNGDTHNNAFWDERSGKYLWFTKLYAGERLVARFESDDFLSWKNNGLVLRSNINEGRDSQTYCMPVFRYGSIYLGYVMMYNVGRDRSVDCELSWSHDALQWQRVAPGTPFIPRGAKGSYDSECIYAMAGEPIIKDGKLMIFYGGDDFPHTGWKRHCLPCLATLRVDGFAGYEAMDAGQAATVITSAFHAEQVRVSADVSAGGSIQIKALDDQNRLVDEAEAITTAVTDAPLRWKRGAVAGKALHFEVRLEHARLYALSGVDLVHPEMKKPAKPSDALSRTPHPISSKSLSFDDNVQGWKGADQIEHHRDGGAKGGFVRISRSTSARPFAFSPSTAKESPLAGDWTVLAGGKGAKVSCQVHAAKPAGSVVIEIFARDIAQWSIETKVPFTNDWTQVLTTLRYDWSDEEARAAGWKRSSIGFSWSDTIKNVGKVVIATAGAAPESFDLEEITVTGSNE